MRAAPLIRFPAGTPSMTVEAWAALPEDTPGELVDGHVVEEEVPDVVHETVLAWLFAHLVAWVGRRGRVFASGLKFRLGDDRGRMPDLSVFLDRRPLPPHGAVPVPPDVAVEIVSGAPSDTRRDRVEKPGDYAAFGVRWYWIVDPRGRTLEVWELRDGAYARVGAAATGPVSELPGCPGLVLDLDALWDEVDAIYWAIRDRGGAVANVIPSTWSEFPAALSARFGKDLGKQRTMQHEGHLLIVLHLVPAHDAVERVGAVFWRDPAGAWKSTPAAKGGLGGLRELLESYRSALAAFEGVMENPGSGAKEYFGVLQGVTPVYRSARSLHRTLQEAREAVPDERELIGARDTAAEIERTAELLQADAKSAIDYTIARRAEEQAELAHRIARSGHRLNLIAAFFLPLSALGSLFGANLAHGLEGFGAPWLFWTFVALSLAIGLWVRSSVHTADDA